MTEQNKAVEAALPDSFSRKVSRVTDDVLAHVERVCGDLSRSPTVNEFDDDYSVLRHNIYAVIGLAFRDNHERLDALSRPTQTADAIAKIDEKLIAELGHGSTVAVGKAMDILTALHTGKPYRDLDAQPQAPDAVEQFAVGVTPCIAGCRFPLEDHSDGCEGSLEFKYTQATPTPDSGLAGELAELQSKASDGPWAYRPEEFDDWGFIRGPLRTVDWADYPVRPFVAQARHSDLQDDELHAQCRREKRDPYIDDAKLIVWLRNHVPEILTALQSNSDSELLRRVQGCAYPVCQSIDKRGYRWCEAYLDQVKPEIDKTLARLEQGAG